MNCIGFGLLYVCAVFEEYVYAVGSIAAEAVAYFAPNGFSSVAYAAAVGLYIAETVSS